MTIEQYRAAGVAGIELSCRRNRHQPGLPRVLFLHGFPEAAFVWDELMQALEGEANAVAPNLRGFEHSTAPAELEQYRPKHLVADVRALIQQFGEPVDLLVAHDWGGALAWSLAAQAPQALRRLLILNSPHPATFLRELLHSAAQQAASRYMNFLCRDDAAALLSANGFERLLGFLQRRADGTVQRPAWLTDAVREQYLQAWGCGVQGGLNYYRASPLKPDEAGSDALANLQLADDLVTVKVPTTVLWGEQDAALLPGLLQGLERWVPQLTVRRLPQASHWLVHEQPAEVLAEVRRCLKPG